MNELITIEASIERDELFPSEYVKKFPNPATASKTADPKDEQAVAAFNVARDLHSRAASADLMAAGMAAKYCEMFGFYIGVGGSIPLTIKIVLTNPTNEQIELRRAELKLWIQKIIKEARLVHKSASPLFHDFMEK